MLYTVSENDSETFSITPDEVTTIKIEVPIIKDSTFIQESFEKEHGVILEREIISELDIFLNH